MGRRRDEVIFVPFSAPGDRLLVRPVKEKKTFVRAEIVRILRPGDARVTPPCPHFGRCGGCHWQHLEYAAQVEAKRLILEEIIHHRLSATRGLAVGMRACPKPFGYRSRARIQMRGRGEGSSVGFFRRGSHAVEDIETCLLFRPSLNEALTSLRRLRSRVDTDFRPREMDIACSEDDGSWATEPAEPDHRKGAPPLTESQDRQELPLYRRIGEFRYQTSASVFFQANDFMVEDLVSLVLESARDAGRDFALDLYSGVGLFTLPLARMFRNIKAVELSPRASRLGSLNASTAGYTHVHTICANVTDWVRREGRSLPSPIDLVVLDPPRAGAGTAVMDQIQKLSPRMILYVSCDPQTLSRDLAVIDPRRYRIDLVEGLDLFPQTYHIETVVRLVRQ